VAIELARICLLGILLESEWSRQVTFITDFSVEKIQRRIWNLRHSGNIPKTGKVFKSPELLYSGTILFREEYSAMEKELDNWENDNVGGGGFRS
jgi:hypothetical protein